MADKKDQARIQQREYADVLANLALMQARIDKLEEDRANLVLFCKQLQEGFLALTKSIRTIQDWILA